MRVLPDPAPIEVLSYEWSVITADRVPQGDGWVLYAVTPRDYETMSRNAAEVLRWVEEARWRLDHYRSRLTPETQEDGR